MPTSPTGTGETQAFFRNMVEVSSAALRNELSATMQAMQTSFGKEISDMKTEISDKLGGAITQINAKMVELDRAQYEIKESGKLITEGIDKQNAETVTNLQAIVASAQSEFNATRSSINEVVSAVKLTQSTFEGMITNVREEVNTLKGQVSSLASVGGGGTFGAAADDQVKKELESIKAEILLLKSNPGGGTFGAAAGVGGGKLGGFIQWKDLLPKAFGSREEAWRDWVEEVRDYLDLIRPGMKAMLMAAELERDTVVIDAAWAAGRDPQLGAESTAMWRALKKLTEEGTEARQVVTSVPGEDGYAAWVKLHRRFGMALAMRQGTMLANFSQLAW